MNMTRRHFHENLADANERGRVALGQSVLACRWRLGSEGRLIGVWQHESSTDGEHCAWMSVEAPARDPQNEAQSPGQLKTVISWITIGASVAISVVGSLVIFLTEPSQLF